MRSLLLIAAMSLSLMSCSSQKINDTKIKSANSVGRAVEKELAEEYEFVTVEGKDCAAEAKITGEKAREKVLELLRAKDVVNTSTLRVQAFADVGGVVPVLCTFVIEAVLPPMIEDASSEYACLRALGAEKLSKVGADLCNAIDI